MGAEKGKEWRVGVEGQQCLQLGRSRVLEVDDGDDHSTR